MPETLTAPSMPAVNRMPAGSTAPMTVPPVSSGLRSRAFIKAGPIIKEMTAMVQLLGATTPEGRDVLKALTIMSKIFGQSSGDLTRQEAKMVYEKAAPVAQPPQQQMQAALRSQGLGMSSPATPTAPPGG